MGVTLVTSAVAEAEDVDNPGMALDVNGVHRQTGSAAMMLCGMTHSVHRLSRFVV